MTNLVHANVHLATPTRHTKERVDDLLGAWLETLTENSTRSYRADLKYFAGWLGTEELSVAMQTLFQLKNTEANALVLRYRRHLQTTQVEFRGEVRQGYAPGTINRRIAALRSVARIARITGVFDGRLEIGGVHHSAVVDVRGIGGSAYHRIIRKLDQIERTKMKPRRRWELVRDRAIIRLLHDQALRRVEVVRLQLEDVELDGPEPSLWLRPKGHKGARDRILVSERVSEAVRKWIVVRGDHKGALFHSYRPMELGQQLNLSTVNRICARRGRQAKLSMRCRPHGLRHTAITTGLERTGDVRSVANLARHKNPATTLRYDDSRKRAARDLSDLIGRDES